MKKLNANQFGFSHIVVATIIVVAIAIGGTAYLVASHADSYTSIINYGGTNKPERDYAPGNFNLSTSSYVSYTYGYTDVLSFQSDGNLVLYKNGSPVWSSRTNGEVYGSNGYLALQNDGNVVIYNVKNSGYYGGTFIAKKAVWASGTNLGSSYYMFGVKFVDSTHWGVQAYYSNSSALIKSF